jgi:hypothetical protein
MLCHVVGSFLHVLKKHTSSSGTCNTEDEGEMFLQDAGKKLPNPMVQQSKRPGSSLQNMFATTTSLQHCVMSSK